MLGREIFGWICIGLGALLIIIRVIAAVATRPSALVAGGDPISGFLELLVEISKKEPLVAAGVLLIGIGGLAEGWIPLTSTSSGS